MTRWPLLLTPPEPSNSYGLVEYWKQSELVQLDIPPGNIEALFNLFTWEKKFHNCLLLVIIVIVFMYDMKFTDGHTMNFSVDTECSAPQEIL